MTQREPTEVLPRKSPQGLFGPPKDSMTCQPPRLPGSPVLDAHWPRCQAGTDRERFSNPRAVLVWPPKSQFGGHQSGSQELEQMRGGELLALAARGLQLGPRGSLW